MTTTPLQVGASARRRFRVTADDTASALGSGALAVLATPRLLAWMEAVTCEALDGALETSQTSVGTRVTLEHLKASRVGAEVEIDAAVQYLDGRLVRFEVVAANGSLDDGEIVGRAEVTRVMVDIDRFMARLS
jgi:fluoroacetyl-CoA thioesterase